MGYILILNKNTIGEILKYLTYIDIINLRITCKQINTCINQIEIWKSIDKLKIKSNGIEKYFPFCPLICYDKVSHIIMYDDGSTEFDKNIYQYGKTYPLDKYKLIQTGYSNINLSITKHNNKHTIYDYYHDYLYVHYNKYRLIDSIIVVNKCKI